MNSLPDTTDQFNNRQNRHICQDNRDDSSLQTGCYGYNRLSTSPSLPGTRVRRSLQAAGRGRSDISPVSPLVPDIALHSAVLPATVLRGGRETATRDLHSRDISCFFWSECVHRNTGLFYIKVRCVALHNHHPMSQY
jgi:hypothetical protein